MWSKFVCMRNGTTILFLFWFSLIGYGQKDSLLSALSTASDTLRPQILIELCDASMNQNNQEALSYAEQAIEAAAEVDDQFRLAKAHLMRGELLSAFERLTESRSDLVESLSIATNLGDTPLLADIHGALGGLYAVLYDHEKALHHFRIGIDLARSTEHIRLLVKIMNNMANVFEIQGEYELALKTFIQCSEALEGTDYEEHRVYYITLLNSGMVSNAMGDHKTAVVYMKRALQGFKKLELSDLEVHTLVGLVHSYTNLGQLDSAMAYHTQTLSYNDEFEFAVRKHYRDQTYVELLYKMKRYSEVIALARAKLDEIGSDTNYVTFSVNAAKMLYQSYKDMGDNTNALRYLELYNELNSYAMSQRAEEEVQSMRTRFETELDFEAQRREIVELQLKEDLQNKEIEKQKNWRNFILATAILGLVISLLILNSLKLKKRASEAEASRLEVDNSKLLMEVEHKNRELTSTAMFVSQKNQMLMNLQDHLINLSDSGISQKELRAIRNQIKENINLEEDWEKIKLHFEEVYPKFFANLKERYPQLTPLELKHCAYLKMGLSVKEVARMLSVAPKSVQMSHYRLKKKLDLSADDSLLSHLAQF